jgi:isoleucyl-tRNA synthetase
MTVPVPARHQLLPARVVDPRQELAAVELAVLERWRERGVFAESLRLREGAQPWVFYEGPPTANGRPGLHHVLARVFKDIYPRYKTMRGYRVQRKGGWDCHGLPVEIGVEQELGLKSKADIEEYGIGAFNAKCRESVFAYLQEWNKLTERIGFWIDLQHAYRTLDASYVESVWWALRAIHDQGLLYEGHKVVPYCYRCGTALSSHEVALGYQDVVDPSVYVRFVVERAPERSHVRAGDALLVWTTTPWTLVANAAVAVAAQVQYVRAEVDGEIVIVAEPLAERVLGENYRRLDTLAGAELTDAIYYTPPFGRLAELGPKAYQIYADDFVTTDDGTGLVHLAPPFGEDDFRVGSAVDIELVNPVRPDGTYDERIRGHDGRSYEGRHVKDSALAQELIEDLRARGLLFKAADYEHSYPHCWRCGTPLIYYAKASWYIKTTAVRERMLAENETVGWHPEHVRHGRFGDWLKNNVDWALSRERYWGTPLPVWRCAQGHTHVIGSLAELHQRSGVELDDPHRPYVDDVQFPCADCAQPMQRVPEVIDVWFDSGAMPFAQHHYPFADQGASVNDTAAQGLPLSAEAEAAFPHNKERFPADFICEAQDQTRGWFYSLLAVSTLLWNATPYRNVVCLGLIVDAEGQKMSKSKGNAVEPWPILERYGADALRWYFFTSKQPWDGYRFSEEAIGEGVRLFLKQLWSTYFFYTLYAQANEHALGEDIGGDQRNDMDAWALSRTAAVAQAVASSLDAYDTTSAGRALAELVDELSNWYVRRSRRRFWDGEPAAFATLRTCLLTVTKLLAPFCPFIADEIYDNLDGELASVHLCDFPTATELPPRDEALEEAMSIARETVRLGLAARGAAKLKVRQPLAEAVVVASGRERAAIERLETVVREELNVRRVRFVAAADELGEYEVKANYRTLGPRFGREMPAAAQAIGALHPAHVAAAVREGRELGIAINGRDHTLTAEDLLLSLRPPEGYTVEREGAHAVALELALDEDLLREGRARELVHAVQNARKNAGLQVEDRIALRLQGDPLLLEAAQAHRDYLMGETLALELAGEGGIADGAATAGAATAGAATAGGAQAAATATMDYSEQAAVDGLPLTISLSRVERS